MQHTKIRSYRLNIHNLHVREYDKTDSLCGLLEKVSSFKNKTV